LPIWAQTADSTLQLLRKTVQNEISSNGNGSKFVFLNCKQTPHGSQARLVVETRQAMAGILVARNGQKLAPSQRRSEEERLMRLVNDPEELKKKAKSEQEDTDRTERIIKAMPEAFLYEANGSEPGRYGIGKDGDELLRLNFRPNPGYVPPSRVEQVLTGMQGYVLIDVNNDRVAEINGTLIRNVNFGWGILGHLDRGGHFFVEQGDVGDATWEITRMDLDFVGKELLLKSIRVSSHETFGDFHPVAKDLSFAQGVDLLKRQKAEPVQQWCGQSGPN